MIGIHSDGIDVLVLPAYRVSRADMQCKVQMERWNESVLDTNAICADLGQKWFQLPGMLTLSRSDTTSYPYDNKRKLASILGTFNLGENTRDRGLL